MFDRKPKMSVQEWCEKFYNTYLFAPSIHGENPWLLFCNSIHNQISQSDSSFSEVDPEYFSDELLSLRLEVIGIAWIMRVNTKLAPKQSECTRLYLQNHKKELYWEKMEPYNIAVAQATDGGLDSSTRKGRAQITFNNSIRMELFDEWISVISDPKDAARPANRIRNIASWKSMKTHVYLSYAFTDQLKYEINEEARRKLLAFIQGFFDGVSQELQNTKIV